MKDYWEEPERKKINTKKIIISIIISIIVVAIIVFVSLYITNREIRNWIDVNIFRKEISQDKVATIDLEEGQTSNIYAFYKYIGLLSKNKLYIYGSSGSEETNLDIQITNPIFSSENRFLAIGESEGQKIYLIEDKEIAWTNDIEGSLLNISVNENGYMAVIISDTIHKSIVQVFDPEGNALFKIFLSSTMVVDVSISNDNKYLALAEVDTSGTIIQSNIRIFSVEKLRTDSTNSEEKKYQSEQNKLVVSIKYQDKNRLVCMYTDSINIIENDQDTVVFENKDKKITSQSIELNNNFIAIEEESSGIFTANSLVNIVDVDSKNLKNYTIESVIKEVYAKGDVIALNTGTEVEFINTSGWLIKRYVASQEVTDVTVSNNIAGIIYRDKVEIINL